MTAEATGFDSIDVSDHFHPWDEKGNACFTWTWLGAAAAKTSRIELGNGVNCPILRYHPAVVAQASATLGIFDHGRSYLVVVTGEVLNEYAVTGLRPDYDEYQGMLWEAIEIIRALWLGDEVNYNGAYYHTRKAKLYTRTDKPIPFYISTMVPESSEFARMHGERWA